MAVGAYAGNGITTGNSNVCIGRDSDTSPTVSRAIAIGREAIATADGELSLGSAAYPLNTAATAGVVSTYLTVRINGTQYKIALLAV